jgi:UDP:flavonoid glycosyltransferase YjiC (YdhE family)
MERNQSLIKRDTCLVEKPADWGAEDRVTGDWHEPTPEAWSPPRDLVAFLDAGPSPVYVGFGSMPALSKVDITGIVLFSLE